MTLYVALSRSLTHTATLFWQQQGAACEIVALRGPDGTIVLRWKTTDASNGTEALYRDAASAVAALRADPQLAHVAVDVTDGWLPEHPLKRGR